MYGHRSLHKINKLTCTSAEVLDCGDAEIYLIETPKCKSLDELRRREGQIIEETDCVNKIIAGRSPRCEHDRPRNICKECGGSSICEHERIRYQCKDCGGSGICEHNKKRSLCVECKGSQICEHNRQKYQCKDCGGSEICEHNVCRAGCQKCGGSQAQKYICECGVEIRKDSRARHLKTKKHLDGLPKVKIAEIPGGELVITNVGDVPGTV